MRSHLLAPLVFTVSMTAATVPAGTEIHVRLLTEVSSAQPSGQSVRAVVTVPVFVNNELVIPAHTELSGKTADAHAAVAADQGQEHPATLRIDFTAIDDRSGHSKPLSCVLEAVDNARESVDQAGLITGITESQTIEARINQGIGKVSARNSQFGDLLSGIESAFVKKVDPEIDYKPGVDLVVKLTKPLDWSASSKEQPSVAAIEPAAALQKLVEGEPFRTVAQNPPKPSDMTNLMFIGTSDQVHEAFRKAGWSSSEKLSRDSKLETARAIIENRGYSEAPMSILMLDGQPPEMTFQKQNNTFAKRHHIRVWRRPDTFNGKPVWVAAATHDISMTFSQTSRTFSHGIDPNIDEERSQVVNDLVFTGDVHALALVDRSFIPKDASNATGDKLITDGKMAVLEF